MKNNNINLVEVQIDELKANPWNPNVQTEFVFEKNKKSLEYEGQLLPIVVREVAEGFEIVDGEHRWRSAKQLGWTHVQVNNLGALDDSRAMLIGQKLNRISGVDDKAKLRDMYQDLLLEVSKEEILAQLPVLEFEIDAILAEVSGDWADMPSAPKVDKKQKSQGSSGGDDSDEWAEINLRVPLAVKEQFDDQLTRFKKLLYPNDEPADVSFVMPFEAMIQVLVQTPDEHVMGSEL